MKILILSDSLALPREKPEVCVLAETWPELLKMSGHVVYQVSIGGATTTELYRQCPYYSSFHPEVVIVQAGIVDCSPRFMGRTEQKIVKKIPFFGSGIMRLMNKPWVRKMRKLTYTDLRLFTRNINGISGYFPGSRCIFIGILPGSPEYEKIIPGVTHNINRYNKVLARDPSGFISLNDIPTDCVMSDHHHLNRNGHQYIYRKIAALMES